MTEPDEACHIDQLNDDCLIHVFSFLPILDRIRIERVSKRWKGLSLQSWRTAKALNLREDSWGVGRKIRLTVNRHHFVKVLNRCGRYVSHVDLSRETRPIHVESCKFVVCSVFNMCPKIASLNLGRPHAGAMEQTLEYVAGSFESLSRLAIVVAEPSFEDQATRILAKNALLEDLTLFQSNLDGSCLERLNPEICRELHFESCKFKTLRPLLTVLERSKVLRKFGFKQCSCQDVKRDSLLQAVALNSKTLTKLELHFYEYNGWEREDPDHFSSLVNLEVLKLSGRILVNDDFLTVIGNSCTKLKQVDLEDSDQLSDDGLGSIVILPELRHLRLNSLSFVTDKVFSNMPFVKRLECIRCTSVGNAGFLSLLVTSSSIEHIEVESYYDASLQSSVILPWSLIEAGVSCKLNKLTIKIEAEFGEPINDCIFLKKSMIKFDGRVIKKSMSLCLECFRKSPDESRECSLCRDTVDVSFVS